MLNPSKISWEGSEIIIRIAVLIAGIRDPAHKATFNDISFGPCIRIPMPMLPLEEIPNMVGPERWDALSDFQRHLLLLTSGHPRRIDYLVNNGIETELIPAEPPSQDPKKLAQVTEDIRRAAKIGYTINFIPEILRLIST